VTHTPAARPLLWPLVPLYWAGLELRELGLRSGLAPIHQLRWPVVSIGNLSTGGSGKTPLTIALARAIAARGLHVDVLSRGYGRRRSVLPLAVDPRGTAENFGDEPLEIVRTANVPVYVAAERCQAGLLAEHSVLSGLGLHLLDDGFQHRQLARDVDILLLTRRDMNDHLLPAGNLREALRAAERAHVVAIPADEPEVEAQLKTVGWQGTVWRLRRRMEITQLDGPVAAFCGIARPAQFFQGLEAAGIRLAARFAFPDHHRYTGSDLQRIATESKRAGATVLFTTEKDRIRLGALAGSLPASLRLHAVPLRIEIEDEATAIDWLMHRVAASRQASR
jgi:tetraacyldisaccharide 4'-kinase